MKYLLIIAIIALLWWLGRSKPQPRSGARRGAAPEAPQPMVRCAHCGVHLPQSDALSEAGAFYCGEAHRRLGPRQADAA